MSLQGLLQHRYSYIASIYTPPHTDMIIPGLKVVKKLCYAYFLSVYI